MLKSVDSQCFTKLEKIFLYTSKGLLSVIFSILGWDLDIELHNYFRCERPLCFRSRCFLNDLNAHPAPDSRLGFRLAEWARPSLQNKGCKYNVYHFLTFRQILTSWLLFRGLYTDKSRHLPCVIKRHLSHSNVRAEISACEKKIDGYD